ncbi:MAG TPA: CHAT domain-containing protein [Thermoanaerobaculia bacterium]|jgi:CHAT domain-containing protein|nr:CHAT domain-containing protein [Thermoanaerobaculia bacterium]
MSPVLLLLLALPPSSQTASKPAELSGFARCEELAGRLPESEETARCFEETGEAPERTAEAMARLRELLERYPGSPWPTLYLGYLDSAHAEALSRAALAGFIARRDAKGEVFARTNLHRLLYRTGRMEEAGIQAQRALAAAEASGQPEVIARGRILQARHLWILGKDLEQAYLMMRRAEALLFPDGNYYAKRDCLNSLGNLSLDLGRFREGLDAFRRMADLAAARGDRYAEANARYGMARAVHEANIELPDENGRRQAAELARRALDAAVPAENRGIEAKAHFMLGILSRGEERHEHFNACLVAADTVRDRSYCLNGLARHVAATDPRQAERLIDEAQELAQQAEDYWSMAFAWRERMRVSWATGSVERAFADSQSALDVIEALRDQQAASSGRAEAFSTSTEDYYWLSGRLLEAGFAGGGTQDLERAFHVAERLRARSLIDRLEAARALPAAAAPIRRQHGAVLERISGIQRRLLDPDLPAAERTAANRELERLEMDEAELRNQLARAAPALGAAPRTDFATLARVRQALGPDEALLSFQIAPWEDPRGGFAGGSWLLAVSRAAIRVYRLPGRGELRSAVRLFNGMFDARTGAEAAPAAGLYRRLLERPLRELPPGVRRLILVPDDALHQLPFGALRAAAQAEPLASRFELTLVPSATLWSSWERHRPPVAPIPALVLADPPMPGSGPRPAAARERSAAVFASGVSLGPLPYARWESRAVVRSLGGDSVRRSGEDASEAFLKTAPLRRFGVLHFATHALTDEANPERSGVLLAPGSPKQDGLLQIREIVDLDLGGRVVVLSACSSNTGTILRGEGVMSLARAFFQAGAHTVVASLWRLRDDEAADFFDRFYRHLGLGASVAAALRAAQRELIAEGAPAAAWAGIVVLGDGDLVPLPGGRKGWSPPIWAWGLAGAAVLLVIGLAWHRRRAFTAERVGRVRAQSGTTPT